MLHYFHVCHFHSTCRGSMIRVKISYLLTKRQTPDRPRRCWTMLRSLSGSQSGFTTISRPIFCTPHQHTPIKHSVLQADHIPISANCHLWSLSSSRQVICHTCLAAVCDRTFAELSGSRQTTSPQHWHLPSGTDVSKFLCSLQPATLTIDKLFLACWLFLDCIQYEMQTTVTDNSWCLSVCQAASWGSAVQKWLNGSRSCLGWRLGDARQHVLIRSASSAAHGWRGHSIVLAPWPRRTALLHRSAIEQLVL